MTKRIDVLVGEAILISLIGVVGMMQANADVEYRRDALGRRMPNQTVHVSSMDTISGSGDSAGGSRNRHVVGRTRDALGRWVPTRTMHVQSAAFIEEHPVVREPKTHARHSVNVRYRRDSLGRVIPERTVPGGAVVAVR